MRNAREVVLFKSRQVGMPVGAPLRIAGALIAHRPAMTKKPVRRRKMRRRMIASMVLFVLSSSAFAQMGTGQGGGMGGHGWGWGMGQGGGFGIIIVILVVVGVVYMMKRK